MLLYDINFAGHLWFILCLCCVNLTIIFNVLSKFETSIKHQYYNFCTVGIGTLDRV